MKRLLTATFLLPPVLYLVLLAPPLLFLAAVLAVALVTYREFTAIAGAHGLDSAGSLGYACGALVLLLPNLDGAWLVLLVTIAFLRSLNDSDLARVLPRASGFVLGVLYVFGAWRCGVGLRAIPDAGPYWLVYAMLVTWIGDIAAYYVGSLIGRHKLAPRISPGKSWEGAIASVVASVIFGVLFLGRLVPTVPLVTVAVLSLVTNIAGQFGDLCESALKRGAGVKDSGTLLPGHGGWLDRLDSCLFAMPVVYFWLSRASMLK